MLWWWKRKLRDKDPVIRKKAVDKIANYGERGDSLLIAATHDPDANVRTSTVDHLGWLSDARNVEPLVERFGGKVYPEEFMTVIKAVGRTGDEKAIEGLLRAIGRCLNIYNPGIFRKALFESLCHPGAVDALIGLLRSDDRHEALDTLEKIDSDWRNLPAVRNAMSLLIELAKGGDDDAKWTLDDIDPEWKTSPAGKAAVIQLVSLLGAEEEQQRCRAAVTLGDLNAVEAVEALIEALNDTEAVKVAVAGALGRICATEAVCPLIKALSDGESVKSAAAPALGHIGDLRAIEPLRRCLEDYESPSAHSVFAALSELKWQPQNSWERILAAVSEAKWQKAADEGTEAIAPLARMIAMRDLPLESRVKVSKVLVDIDSEETVFTLMKVLDNDDELVRAATKNVLNSADISLFLAMIEGSEPAKMSTSLARMLFDKNRLVSKLAIEALARAKTPWGKSTESQNLILELTKDIRNRRSQAKTTKRLAKTKDPAAIPILQAALRRRNADDVKFSIIEAILALDESKLRREDLEWYEDAKWGMEERKKKEKKESVDTTVRKPNVDAAGLGTCSMCGRKVQPFARDPRVKVLQITPDMLDQLMVRCLECEKLFCGVCMVGGREGLLGDCPDCGGAIGLAGSVD